MSGRHEIETRREQITGLCHQHRVAQLFVFGSVLRDDFDPERSDIDFGVEFLPGTWQPWMGDYFELAQALEKLFQRPIDLGPLGAFKNEAVAHRVSMEQEQLYAA